MELVIGGEMLKTGKFLGEAVRDLALEGELALPPGCPPCESPGACRARVRDLRAAAREGAVYAEGFVEIELNYLAKPESEGADRREYAAFWTKEDGAALAFAEETPLAGVTPESLPEAEAAVRRVIFEAATGGPLRCRVELSLIIRVFGPETTRVAAADGLALPERVQVAREVIHLEEELGRAENEVALNTVLALPEIRPDLVRVLARTVRVADLGAEIVRGRVIVNGRLEVGVVYVGRTEEGTAIEANEWGGEGRAPIGFEAFLDLAAPEGALLEPRAFLGRCRVEVAGPREIKLEAALLVSVRAVRVREIPLVTGLVPGPEETVDLRWAQVDCADLLARREGELTLEATLELPPGKPGAARVLAVVVEPRELRAEASEGRCLCEGWLDADLFYLAEAAEAEEGELGFASWRHGLGSGLPVSDLLEIAEARPDLEAGLSWRTGRVRAELVDSRTVRLVVKIFVVARIFARRTIPAVMDAALVPLAPMAGRPSMLFYVVQPGDSLWNIARRYTTTVEALIRTNGLAEPEAVPAGTKLLIPKSPAAV